MDIPFQVPDVEVKVAPVAFKVPLTVSPVPAGNRNVALELTVNVIPDGIVRLPAMVQVPEGMVLLQGTV